MQLLYLHKIKLGIVMFLLLQGVLMVFAQDITQDITVDTIIDRLEVNQVFEGLKTTGAITVSDKYGTRETSFIMHSKESDYSLIEFTSAAERGQKILRVKDKIYLYYPDAEQVVSLNQSMFQQSILNSDISYEDISGDKSVRELFEVVLEDTEMKQGQRTYRIYLSAKNERKETYPYQRMWVRADTFTLHAAEFYTRKKKLRKILEVQDITPIQDGRYMVSKMIFSDALKKDSSTTVVLQDIHIETMPQSVFSIERLKF